MFHILSITCLNVLFICLGLIKLTFWAILFIRLLFKTKASLQVDKSSFSVIVCIKNDAEYLKNLINIADQQAISELILVDDFSDKYTKEQINKLQMSKLKVIHASENISGKKNALTCGISASNEENLLLTDIDCQPASAEWGTLMTRPLMNGYDLVLGYGAYRKKAGLLNRFIRFDTLMIAIQYFSFALINRPYMGVGRNMAYSKSLFKTTEGFSNHLDLASGDDDLFVQSLGKQAKVYSQLEPDAFTISEPKSTWSEFIGQKARHISTATAYQWFHQVILVLFSASHILFYFLFFTLLLISEIKLLILIYLMTIFHAWILFYKLSKKFNESDLAKWFPFLDIIYFIYMLVLFPALFIKKKTW